MTLNTLSFLTKPIAVKSWILAAVTTVYIALSLCIYFQWVAPSLDGRTDQHIAADSKTYLYFATSLREGRPDPLVIAALASFPNTLWFPVMLALVIKSTFFMVVVNYGIFFLAVALLRKSVTFSTGLFIGLLLLNATTTVSLLSVNKEIVDFLAVSMFFFAYRTHRRGLLLLTLLLALVNRFEVCLVMLLFLFVQSRLNLWRRRRIMTVVILIIALSVMLPLLASGALARRAEEASAGGVIVWLDYLEMHYLYGVAVLPKIAENFFGELVNVSNWKTSYSDFSDIANSYVLLSNNLATAVVLVILATKRALAVRSDLIYFAMLGCIIMPISLVIQPRYFYFVYVVLCLQATSPKGAKTPSLALTSNSDREIQRA